MQITIHRHTLDTYVEKEVKSQPKHPKYKKLRSRNTDLNEKAMKYKWVLKMMIFTDVLISH